MTKSRILALVARRILRVFSSSALTSPNKRSNTSRGFTVTGIGAVGLRQESVLVLINLGDKPVDSYALSLETSALPSGTYSLTSILGEGEFVPLSVNSQGGFFNYELLPEIPAYAVLVLQLGE